MRRFVTAALCSTVFLTTPSTRAQDFRNAISVHQCTHSCISVDRLGDMLLFSAVDPSGKRVKTVAHNLAETAGPIAAAPAVVTSSASQLPSPAIQAQSTSTGAYAQTSTAKYESPAETIFVTVTFYYSASGTLLDVSSTEKRIPRTTTKAQ
ncbi:MAG: hypothetical protein U1E77_21180 [Inhella sp.]